MHNHCVTIADRSNGRDNNFNLIRMIAATAVMVSHAYPLTMGKEALEPFDIAFDEANLGRLGVFTFFAISGFYITLSYQRRYSVSQFVWARILRLFPALFVMLCIVTTFAGFFLTTAPLYQYWPAVPEYIFDSLTLFKRNGNLPGVFDNNPLPNAVNGSLWTLQFEVLCYIGVLLLGSLGFLKSRAKFSFVVLISLICYIYSQYWSGPWYPFMLMYTGLPFLCGMFFYIWRDSIPLQLWILIILVVLSAIMRFVHLPLFEATLVFALSYGVFIAGFARIPFVKNYNMLGDYSYGVYIYAFPIQQSISALTDITDPLTHLCLAIPLTFVCAAMSWHFIEKPALLLKTGTARSMIAGGAG